MRTHGTNQELQAGTGNHGIEVTPQARDVQQALGESTGG